LLDIPSNGQHLWNWYKELSGAVGRIHDGVCYPIPWSEILAWITLRGHIVYSFEIQILVDMDEAFCDETNKELQAFHERITNPAPGQITDN
jgi:hypothetical protein